MESRPENARLLVEEVLRVGMTLFDLVRPAARRGARRMSDAFTLGKGMPRISSKNQVTLPVHVLSEVGLKAGDEVAIEATPDGAIAIRRSLADIDAAIGIFSGLYEPGYLRKMRDEDWD